MPPIIVVCLVVLVGSVAVAWRWRGFSFRAPRTSAKPSAGEIVRRFAWYAALAIGAGIPTGLAVIGCGGRLAMRLLAVTAGDDAQGAITEADEVVGAVTVDGTIAFVLFQGVFGGVVTAAIYLLVRRFLPPGRLGGVVFGLGLLAVLGTTVDPLRGDNVDFDIVGPPWVAITVFTLLAIAHGLVLQAAMARFSTWLPVPDAGFSPWYLALLPFLVVGAAATAILAVACLLSIALTRSVAVLRIARSKDFLRGGRIVLAAIVLLSLPNAVSNLVDILGR